MQVVMLCSRQSGQPFLVLLAETKKRSREPTWGPVETQVDTKATRRGSSNKWLPCKQTPTDNRNEKSETIDSPRCRPFENWPFYPRKFFIRISGFSLSRVTTIWFHSAANNRSCQKRYSDVHKRSIGPRMNSKKRRWSILLGNLEIDSLFLFTEFQLDYWPQWLEPIDQPPNKRAPNFEYISSGISHSLRLIEPSTIEREKWTKT